MRVPRKDTTLNDKIEVLQEHYLHCQQNVAQAWATLDKDARQFVEGEIEHCLDLRYYLENYHFITTEQGVQKSLYPFWDHQEMVYEAMQEEWAANGYCKLIILKPRQTGISVWTAAAMFHRTITTPHCFTMIVAQNDVTSEHIYKMSINAYYNLPWWLRPEYMYKTKKGAIEFQRADEKERMMDPGLGSVLQVSPATQTSGVAIGRCQLPETVVWTEYGPRTLQEIAVEFAEGEPSEDDGIGFWYKLRRPLRVYSSDNGESVLRQVTRVYRQRYEGPLQHCKIEGGVDIHKTPEHGVLVEDGWKKNLSVGEFVSRLGHIQCSSEDHDTTYPDEAELIGWQIAEGHELKNAIYISQKSDETRQHIADLVARVAHPKTLYNHPASGRRNKFGNEYVGYVCAGCPWYRKSLESRGYLWGRTWRSKRIPDFIYTSSDECITAFLRGFFEAEGSVSHVIDIGQMSKNLMEGLRFLLARLGITLRFSTVQKKETRADRQNYEWTYYRGFIGGPSLVKFYEKVGFISKRKQDRLRITATKAKGGNTERQVTVTKMMRRGVEESGTTMKYVAGSWRYKDDQMLTTKSAREALRKWRLAIDTHPTFKGGKKTHYAFVNFKRAASAEWIEKIEKELDKEREFDQVTAVTESQYSGMVYDLEVEDTHNYTVAGLITHNTIRALHASEVSRWPNDEVFEGDIKPSMNAMDTFQVFESTGYGRQGLFYEQWCAAEEGENDMRPVFIAVYKVKKYYLPIKGIFELAPDEAAFNERVKKEEHFDIPDEFWNFRRVRMRAAKRSGTKQGFLESYPLTPTEAFQSSGLCAFDRDSLEWQSMNKVVKPLWAGEISLVSMEPPRINTDDILEVKDDEILPRRKSGRGGKRLHVWEWPEKESTYYLSADVALGNGGNYSMATVYRAGVGMEPDTIVATWWGWIPPKAFAKVLCAIGFFYNGCEMAIEYAKDGITTANEVRDMDYPAIYRPQWKDKIVNQATNYLHWFTNAKTRDEIIGCMNEALLDRSVVIRDADLIDEMIDFASLDTDGRSEGQGNDDDGVMSAMIGLYCSRETTKHLKTTADIEHTRSTGELHVYGVYDNLMRQRGQYNTPQEAEKVIEGKAGWRVQPILVCQANTLYSPIFDAMGAEHELHSKYGMRTTEITPDLVWSYKSAMSNARPGGVEDFGDDW